MTEDSQESDGAPDEQQVGWRRVARGDSDGEAGSSDEQTSGSSGSEDGPDDEDERTLDQRVADVPIEMLLAGRQDGKGPIGPQAAAAAAAAKLKHFSRETKNRPQEVSSKRPVPRFREVIQVAKNTSRDPRFEDPLSGAKLPASDSAKAAARHRYAFLYNEVLPAEKAALKQRIKKEKSEGRRRQLQSQLSRLDGQIRNEHEQRRSDAVNKAWKDEQKGRVAAGKAPVYLKAAERRKREVVAKFEELRSAGRLDKYMEKRRKRNAAKDHRYLPSRRREEGGE